MRIPLVFSNPVLFPETRIVIKHQNLDRQPAPAPMGD
jgi:hypothetical protein